MWESEGERDSDVESDVDVCLKGYDSLISEVKLGMRCRDRYEGKNVITLMKGLIDVYYYRNSPVLSYICIDNISGELNTYNIPKIKTDFNEDIWEYKRIFSYFIHILLTTSEEIPKINNGDI
jgi:hypothetical protein